jgi:hypothetical protein
VPEPPTVLEPSARSAFGLQSTAVAGMFTPSSPWQQLIPVGRSAAEAIQPVSPPPSWHFLISGSLTMASLPFYWVTLKSLYSKCLPHQDAQGFGQGLLSSVSAVAQILSPYFTGLTLRLQWLQLFLSVMFALWVLLAAFLMLSYHRLKPVGPTGR